MYRGGVANDILRAWRIGHGLSQTDLARLLREHAPAADARLVQRWESGTTTAPRSANARALMAVTGLTLGELGFRVHADGRGGHDLHVTPTPTPTGRSHAQGQYSGIWRSTYEYYSSSRDETLSCSHHVLVLQQGDRLTVRSLGSSALSMDLTVDGTVITGTWVEVTDSAGYYQGARYHGAIQLLAEPTGRRLVGKWLGFGRDMVVNSGPWRLEFLDASTTTATVERYRREPAG